MDDKIDTNENKENRVEGRTAEGRRSAEEVAWDKEFAEPNKNDFLGGASEFAKLAVQIPATIVTLPFKLIPEETTRHGRAAVREGFLALRSLLGAAGDGIERMLRDPSDPVDSAEVPDGTWGRHDAPRRTRSTEGTNTGGKARRIELTDDEDMERQAKEAIATEQNDGDEEVGEGRGLRAEIEY